MNHVDTGAAMKGKERMAAGTHAHERHLRNEIFYSMAFLCLLQIALIGVSFYVISSQNQFRSEKENIQQLIGIVNQDLESRIGSINDIAFDLVINTELKYSLNKRDPLEFGRARNRVEAILSARVLSAPGINDICLIDRANNFYTTNEIFNLPHDFDFTKTDVYEHASVGYGKLIWLKDNSIMERYSTYPYYSNYQKPGIRAAAIVKDYRQDRILGLLMISINENYFYKLRYASNRLNDVRLYLLSPDKEKIYPVARTAATLEPRIIEQLDPSRASGTFIFGNDRKYLVSSVKNEAMGWTFVSVSSVSSLRQTMIPLIRVLIVILLISLIACLVVAWSSTRYITRGVNELVEKMRQVEQGDFDIRIGNTRDDEIGLLSMGFNSMVDRINRLIESTYKQELLTKDAEFRSLQAQISPHFLNNALDMINWRLLEAGQIELSESVQALGQLFQYSLRKEKNVTLAEEIDHVLHYVTLWQASKHPNFEFINAASCGLDVLVPRLSLQPIIENAVIHGFGRRKNNNILILTTSEGQGGELIVEVADNGIGMDEDTLRNVHSLKPRGHEHHIGIGNVERRLKYRFGNDARMEFESRLGQGTTVRFVIPASGRELR
jgi:two-component system sensor histidine kinase YesM